MKAIKRIIASVFVCMFAVTGGLNALALTPTEDSSTVVSQPVSEGISSETSSQTGSVSSGLSSRADDSGLKNGHRLPGLRRLLLRWIQRTVSLLQSR